MNIRRLVISSKLLLAVQAGLLLPGLATPAAAGPEISIEEGGVQLGTELITGWGDNSNGQLNFPADLGPIQDLSLGNGYAVALRKDGTVVAWGKNDFGQTNVPAGLTGVRAISAGQTHVLAVKGDGTVVAWGENGYNKATVPAGLTGVKAVAAAGQHSVVLKEDGTVMAWGWSSFSLLAIPPGLTDVKAISAVGLVTAALKNDGSVVQWGTITESVPEGLSGVQAIRAGSNHVLALKSDGTLASWGGSFSRVLPPDGLSGVKDIAIGGSLATALREDGTVVSWGAEPESPLAVPAGLEGVRTVFAGPGNTVVSYDSTVHFTGQVIGVPGDWKTFTIRNTGDSPLDLAQVSLAGIQSGEFSLDTTGMLTSVPAGGRATFTVRFTAAGEGVRRATLQVRSNDGDEGIFGLNLTGRRNRPDIVVEHPVGNALETGTVVGWGMNSSVQTDVPAGLHGVKAISACGDYALALKQDGTLSTWGYGTQGHTIVTESLENITAIAAASPGSLAVKSDGTVHEWSKNGPWKFSPPAGLSNVRAVAKALYYSLALKNDGTLVAWGENNQGAGMVPAGLSGVQAIATTTGQSMALKNDGTVVTWPSATTGENVIPAGLSGVSAISIGDTHKVALKNDGTVVAWGSNVNGQTSVPAGLSDVKSIAAGGYHTVALKRDGSLVSWGRGTGSQYGSPAGLSGVTAIAAAGSHTLALRNSQVNFGNQALGAPGPWKTFTIRNSGENVLDLSGAILAGSHAVDFTVDTTGMLTMLPVGGETTISVRFTPLTPGVKQAILSVLSNDPDEGSFEVTLAGSVIPEIAVFTGVSTAPADEREDGVGAHAFPDTFSGNTSTAQTFTIKNTGLSALENIAVSVGGTHPGDFICTAPGATTLAPGAVTTFTVRFAPKAYHSRGAVILISSNDLDENPFEIQVSGNSPPPDISLEYPADTPLATGRVVAWGYNIYGQSTVPVAAQSGVRAVAPGDHHTLALKSDGTLVAWGNNQFGQTNLPAGLGGVQAIAAGWFHNLVLKQDGTVVAWGYNNGGQINVPAGLTDVKSIAAGLYHSAALKNNGTVIAWGSNSNGQTFVPSNLTGVQAIATGLNSTMALRSNGTVIGWGDNTYGQLNFAGVTGASAIAGGIHHSVVLKSNGTVSIFGSNQYGQRDVPAGLSDVVAIAAGEYHTVARKKDGSIVAWGRNDFGQLNIPAGLTDVKSIAAGDSNTAVLVNSRVYLGPREVGSSGTAQRFTLRNTGRDTLNISGVIPVGGSTGDFSVNVSGMLTTLPAGGQTTFTVTFTPSGAGVRQTTLRVTSNDPDEGEFEIGLYGVGHSGTGFSPLDTWRDFHFGATVATAVSANAADPDGDGLSNLLEYAFGTDPAAGTAAAHRPRTDMVSGKFVITYRRPVGGASGVTYHLQKSGAALAGWTNATPTTEYTRTQVPNGDGSETVTLTWLGSPTVRFFRITAAY